MYPSFNARAVGLPLSATETIELAARSGFLGVDLLVRDLVEAGDRPEELRRKMDAEGLRGGAFPLPVSWRGPAEVFDRDLAALPRLAEVAASIGLTRTGTWVMPEELPDGRNATLAFHVDRLGQIADVLARSGIQIGLEVIGPETSRTGATPRFLNRLSELGPILDAIAPRSNVGVLFDAFHLHAADERLDDALPPDGSPIVWVHVADLPDRQPLARHLIVDAERGLPGPGGAVANGDALACLAERGYEGPVTVETLARCRSLQGLSAAEVARTVADSLRSVWPGGGWGR